MAGEVYNLLDYAKQFNKGSKEYDTVKILVKHNPVLDDAVMVEGNTDSGYEYAIQNGLPSVSFRRAYKGVTPSKGDRTVVTETTGLLSSVVEVDKQVAEKGGRLKEVRSGLAEDHLEAMSQKWAEELFYGSSSIESVIGFAARYSSISDNELKSGFNVLDNGGTTPNKQTSIYVIGWGKRKIFTFFAKGSKAGIENIDYSKNGPIDLIDPNNNGTYPGYKEQFELQTGLCVQDWRYGARLANIECDITTDDTRNQNLRKNLMRAINKIYSLTDCKPIIYCNRSVAEMIQFAHDSKNFVNYTPENPNAKPVLSLMGIPVHVCDAIKSTESVVTKEAEG